MSLRCVLLSTDLMLSSQLNGAAARAAVAVATAATAAGVLEQLAASPAPLVAIDLNAPGLDIAQLVDSLRELPTPPKILAFGPHVQELRLEQARAAGCDLVLTRGQFYSRMEAILSDGV